MRGEDLQQHEMFSYGSLEDRVPSDHPLRAIRTMVDAALKVMSPRFDAIYGEDGRRSIPPERLLRALLVQLLYSIRSERMLMEQLEYNLLFRAEVFNVFNRIQFDQPGSAGDTLASLSGSCCSWGGPVSGK